MKKVAVIGTQGVPAKYGGFETLVENIIGDNCPVGIHYTVFCSSKDYKVKRKEYKGVSLKYIPFHANGLQSTPYDIFSMLKCMNKYDVVLILGVSGCVFLPIFRLLCHKRIIVNIDGLEHQRGKWGYWAKKFLKFSEKMAVAFADVIITDNKGIQDYVTEEYGKKSVMIAYGGNHVLCDISDIKKKEILIKYGIDKDGYSFSVCRIEPENNVHLTLEAFEKAGKKILFVGNWMKNEYGRNLFKQYENSSVVKLLFPIYDLEILNVFRSNCSFYVHGHSAGGTNPSLVEAMFFGKPILAFDVVYNRETTENQADYFSSDKELVELLQQKYSFFLKNAEKMKEIAERRYCWETIAQSYVRLFL
ncbi:DUF1972 domain-containing protein [Phocaeicola sp.]